MRVILFSPSAEVGLSVGIACTTNGYEVEIVAGAPEFIAKLGHDPDAAGVFFQDNGASAVDLIRQVRDSGHQNLLFAVIKVPDFDPHRTASIFAMVLNAGADDVQGWPLAGTEIAARIEALSRRVRVADSCGIALPGGAIFDPINQTVLRDDISIHLTGSENRLLEALASRPSACIRKDLCMLALYGGRDECQQKTLDVFICKLRKKLRPLCGDHVIQTQWGQGYRLVGVAA